MLHCGSAITFLRKFTSLLITVAITLILFTPVHHLFHHHCHHPSLFVCTTPSSKLTFLHSPPIVHPPDLLNGLHLFFRFLGHISLSLVLCDRLTWPLASVKQTETPVNGIIQNEKETKRENITRNEKVSIIRLQRMHRHRVVCYWCFKYLAKCLSVVPVATHVLVALRKNCLPMVKILLWTCHTSSQGKLVGSQRSISQVVSSGA